MAGNHYFKTKGIMNTLGTATRVIEVPEVERHTRYDSLDEARIPRSELLAAAEQMEEMMDVLEDMAWIANQPWNVDKCTQIFGKDVMEKLRQYKPEDGVIQL